LVYTGVKKVCSERSSAHIVLFIANTIPQMIVIVTPMVVAVTQATIGNKICTGKSFTIAQATTINPNIIHTLIIQHCFVYTTR
jgi:hypothetical protein